MTNQISKGSALILGVGAYKGLGAAIARRFAKEGHPVLIAGRTEAKLKTTIEQLSQEGLQVACAVGDATKPEDVARFITEAEKLAPLQIAVQNAGENTPSPFLETPAERFIEHWQVHTLSAFYLAQAALPRMLEHGGGSLFFTGASGSLRGKANFAPFASAKAGLRMLAQSLAREFGPRGIHVASVIVDGIIDGDRTVELLPMLKGNRGTDRMLQVDEIARAYWHLHKQHRSAWTLEMDLRPYTEHF
ncbi:SDR family NAD(P)-dependent oxidoreductase [Endozoicomonas sp. GU-1]|uniref:SDR family NAD(P)-dependent oxidoreductase n=1 Tax=Endozoicomonas sp. GU-1 TaxID=3009078 RepID=UPI0022B48397|nr:SDR family NAD(P)-dependent oxidoreductase [Endozoicomonas sp. GU-1]WBA80975.1 SDR family NAD(P)-dependent oxidoreductase [Endozoicomonas sp. GU-1]WBA88543.1 SDR family NAD(P)-dependent oxidoreductase [Endozoicomonas sp. GU-1]